MVSNFNKPSKANAFRTQKISEEERIDFRKVEKKWQDRWEKKKAFEVHENSKKKKYYVLEMYPYPSGSGLHMGHAFQYLIGDVFARFKRMNGFNVLYPMGYDSFGLPAENAAIKVKSHPKKYTDNAIKNFVKQQKSLGYSYDWTRKLQSHDPNYYKWNQWIFLKMFEKGLVYRKKAAVNWCGKCDTVLANEQVHNGKCWRHSDTEVETKLLEQWFIKTTEYADELLDRVDNLDWPERIKIMQKNWIGKSYGTEIIFKIENSGDEWKIYTTRVDTLFGVTFMVVSAQHQKLMELVTDSERPKVEKFLNKLKTASTQQENLDKLVKEGVFTGSYAIHPITNEKIPIYAGNFVVADYGSGMVMAVPAHDQRDFEFAVKYRIPVKVVIESNETKIITIEESLKSDFYKSVEKFAKVIKKNGLVEIYTEDVEGVFEASRDKFVGVPWYIHSEGKIKRVMFHSKGEDKIFDWSKEKELKEAKAYGLKIGIKKEQLDFDELREAYAGEGYLVNSGSFNDLESKEAKRKITKYLEERRLGHASMQFKLKDWLVSRQRYWGTPIPIIYCKSCGIVPVPEKDLPIRLPDKVKFGKGNPLATNKKFVEVKCPKCKSKARRETDTMDTFFDSSWYYLRFTDSKNNKKMFDSAKADYWMPVDFYTGGAEHACMHLIYARFFTKVLRDMKMIKIDEPFTKLFNQGMLHGEDGTVMSKSNPKFNIDPLEIISKYSTDSLRLFLISNASPDKDFNWSQSGIGSSYRLVCKIFEFFMSVEIGESSKRLEHKINKAIKEATESLNNIRYNFTVISLRTLFEDIEKEEKISKEDAEAFIKLLSPFCPHIAEELWEKFGNKTLISLEKWPSFDEKKIDLKLEESEKAIDKTVSDVLNIIRILKDKEGKEAEKIYIYVMPFEVALFKEEGLSKRVGKSVKVYAVNDKSKYDPKGFAGKAKPGRPALYLE